MKNKKSKFDWQEELLNIAEKYCEHEKHKKDKYGGCLYFIVGELIDKIIKTKAA
jgi:hypothetical protein